MAAKHNEYASNAQKCPLSVFHLSAAADVQPFPFWSSREKMTQMPSLKKLAKKRQEHLALFSKKNEGKLDAKKPVF
jgi:hypothetical protein